MNYDHIGITYPYFLNFFDIYLALILPFVGLLLHFFIAFYLKIADNNIGKKQSEKAILPNDS